MKDETMPLNERIEAAIKRITTGHAAMRVPAEATDPDLVLSDCAARIADLEAMLREAGAALAIWKDSFPDQWDDDDEAILTKLSAAGLLPKETT